MYAGVRAGARARKFAVGSHVAEQTGLADAIRGRCSDMFSRTTASVVLGRVQLRDAAPVLYPWAIEGSNPSSRPCAADMTVLQNHMSKGGQMGVANAMPGPGSENAILGRR